ncbi:unnamed protein product [marine sediment metagenome]|uniref:Uncharacterized protein n=1 Tax=marine sediment metagenome TaxID=412755 RepID=X1A9D9_9ZZZZ
MTAKKRPWKLASGHRKKSTATERKKYLASRKRRKNQEFRVQKNRTEKTYPWEVQYRKKK